MNSPTYKAIVAMAANRVIGRNGDLPWRLSEDLKFFKRTTSGHAILMGRKTWDSIGRPLPNRRNIVLSRVLEAAPEGAELVRSVDQLGELNLAGDVYVIGGSEIYRALLPQCQEVLLSYVFEEHEGDTFLPPFESDFEMVEVLESFSEFEIRRYVRS